MSRDRHKSGRATTSYSHSGFGSVLTTIAHLLGTIVHTAGEVLIAALRTAGSLGDSLAKVLVARANGRRNGKENGRSSRQSGASANSQQTREWRRVG